MTQMSDWQLGPDGTPGPLLAECLHAAIAAPSIHNTQPWQFALAGDNLDVFADYSRRLEVIDPRGREVLISVGAALLNLRVAILAHGRIPVTRLLPDPARPELVARVRLGAPVHITDTARRLAQAIPSRRTNRRPFTNTRVPDSVLGEFVAAARTEGGHLAMADPGGADALLSLARTAEKQQRVDPRYWQELGQWTRPDPTRRDGVPAEAYGPWSAMESMPIRDFGLIEPARHRGVAAFEEEPTIAVLYSANDFVRDWLVVGQALERVLLTATVRGVASTVMTQPVEVPRLRELLADVQGGRAPQAVIRFGYGPPCPATPRRPLAEVLSVSSRPEPKGQPWPEWSQVR